MSVARTVSLDMAEPAVGQGKAGLAARVMPLGRQQQSAVCTEWPDVLGASSHYFAPITPP